MLYRVLVKMPGVFRVIGTNAGINIRVFFVVELRIGEFSSFGESLRAKQFELRKC